MCIPVTKRQIQFTTPPLDSHTTIKEIPQRHDDTLSTRFYRSGDSKLLCIYCHCLFPPKDSIKKHTVWLEYAPNNTTEHLSVGNKHAGGDAFGICHTEWLIYPFDVFFPVLSRTESLLFTILLIKVPFRCNKRFVHFTAVSLTVTSSRWMKLSAHA